MAKFGIMLEVQINDEDAVNEIIEYLNRHKNVDTALLNEGPDPLIDSDEDDDSDEDEGEEL